MGQLWQSFKAWLGTGNWSAAGKTVGRWTLPAFFYSSGIALALRTMMEYKSVGFTFVSVSRQIQEWLIFFDSGNDVNLGRLVDSGSSVSFYVPWIGIFALVFLVIAYKLTPKP